MNGYRWSPFLIDCGGPYLSIDAYTTTHSISCSSKAGVPGDSDSIHLTTRPPPPEGAKIYTGVYILYTIYIPVFFPLTIILKHVQRTYRIYYAACKVEF